MIKKSVLKEISDSSLTTIYTVPTGKATELCMVWVTNPDSGNKDFHLEVYSKKADASIVVLDDYPMNDKDILQLGGTENTFVVMYEGDSIKAQGSSNSNFKVLLSIKEHNDVIQGG